MLYNKIETAALSEAVQKFVRLSRRVPQTLYEQAKGLYYKIEIF